jgi:hypothetical protein
MTHLRVSFAVAVVTVTAVIPLAHGDGDNDRAFKAKNESGEARTINVAGFRWSPRRIRSSSIWGRTDGAA